MRTSSNLLDRAEVIDECPPPEKLHQFASGQLTSAETKSIVEHIGLCDDCGSTVLSFGESLHLARTMEWAEIRSTCIRQSMRIKTGPATSAEEVQPKENEDSPNNPAFEETLVVDGHLPHSESPDIGNPFNFPGSRISEGEFNALIAELSSDQKLSDPQLIRQHMVSITVEIPRSKERPLSPGVDQNRNGPPSLNDTDLPAGARIGRYVITKLLGRGGFATVFQARDSELDRLVAIKLPHLNRIFDSVERLMYLAEARTLAQLDHPGIVPIYDFGVISDGRCFVVSKFIDGQDLAHVFGSGNLEIPRSVSILISVADALQHVHESRMVHRDIKPGNLLVGNDGRVYVADFGLALRESRYQPTYAVAGTPSYMSPEQIRGEGHRVDGRSDQFSLGCVMYQALTGIRPFTGRSATEILERVLSQDPLSPRELNPKVPRELNRICLKLLSKLASERYPQTQELAEDLRIWLSSVTASSHDMKSVQPIQRLTAEHSVSLSQSHLQLAVVPRGLRAFTPDDADFFLNLLPGTRGRDGLPPVLSHWKCWVSPHDDAPEMHRVGVISGPVGCGKSSLVRAGLFPVLAPQVVTVLVEASADATERQLVAAIERRCDESVADTLPELITAIRRGHGLPAKKTLLIVIDQFEQWLHAHPEPLGTELVRAIRQCDGIRVQCLILVRDDFWLALNRFMDAVELPLVLRKNALMVDLFDRPHARKVLIEFGRGYERLPGLPLALTREQERFVDQVLTNLETNGKIFPVHLALFAEMVKSREWLPSTLRQIGGAVGVGAQFLTESFSANHAPADQRANEVPARQILQALLPAVGTEIKASRRPRAELLDLSGCADRPVQFDALMERLETDLKLISAAEPLKASHSEQTPPTTAQAEYQLSHDFLVPSIREWLSAKQRETYRGRLHLRITERAGVWNQHRDARFMPGFWEWLQARCCLRTRCLAGVERDMLAARDSRSMMSIAAVVLSLVLLTFSIFEVRGRMRASRLEHQAQLRASGLVDQLQTAEFSAAPRLFRELTGNRRLAEPLLERKIANSDPGSRSRFMLRVAQLPWNPQGAEEVFHHVLDQSANSDSAEYVKIATKALRPFAGELTPRCWSIIESPDETAESLHLCAAQLLATFDPPVVPYVNKQWELSAPLIADQLTKAVSEHPHQFENLAESLRPVQQLLIPHLAKFVGIKTYDIRARFAIDLLVAYTTSNHQLRTALYLNASDWQRPLVVSTPRDLSVDVLWNVVREQPLNLEIQPNPMERDQQQAFAAALLLWKSETNQDLVEIWELLKRSPNPSVRSCLIHNLRPLGVPLRLIVDCVLRESDPGIVSALMQATGEFNSSDPALTKEYRSFVAGRFQIDPDAGIHSSAEWLLRLWGDLETIIKLEPTPPDIRLAPELSTKDWIVTPQGHTFVRISGRQDDHVQRDFLISSKEVTIQQILKFDPGKYVNRQFGPTDDCPANVVKWLTAHEYCNWLSIQEGLEPCYPQRGQTPHHWAPDAEHLARTGYRLPTTQEWEFACRAGTQSDRSFGNEITLLGKYAWFQENSKEIDDKGGAKKVSSRVGLLKPNDSGLFDMYGNVMEWCDNYVIEASLPSRPIYGGSVNFEAAELFSDAPKNYPIDYEWNTMGFRIVRTIHSKP